MSVTSCVSSRRPRPVRLALVGLVVVLLTGCGVHPGAAAVVGSQVIDTDQVDSVASALCAANASSAEASGQPVTALPSRGARLGALQVLIDSELSRQFGRQRGVRPDQSMVSQALAQNAATLRSLPPSNRAAFSDALTGFAEGQLTLIKIGRRALMSQGRQAPSQTQAIAEGTRQRNAWAKDVTVEVDPRYGTYTNGALNPGSGSLSVPVSSRAVSGNSADPSQAWVAGLPASQKCG